MRKLAQSPVVCVSLGRALGVAEVGEESGHQLSRCCLVLDLSIMAVWPLDVSALDKSVKTGKVITMSIFGRVWRFILLGTLGPQWSTRALQLTRSLFNFLSVVLFCRLPWKLEWQLETNGSMLVMFLVWLLHVILFSRHIWVWEKEFKISIGWPGSVQLLGGPPSH